MGGFMEDRSAFRGILNTLVVGLVLASSASSAGTLTRTIVYDYDATGLLTRTVVEPGDSTLCLASDYTNDANIGYRKAETVRNCNGTVGSSPANNSEAPTPTGDPVFASRTSSIAYDAIGKFPVSLTNAMGHSETTAFDPQYGNIASLIGPNGLQTQWKYDAYGRKTREIAADGTQTQIDYLFCSGINGGTTVCPSMAWLNASAVYVIQSTPLAADGITQNGPITKVYFDALDRPIRTETQGFDGSGASAAIYQDTLYDSLGHPYWTSRPYYAGGTVYGTTITYDALDRPTLQSLPDGTSTTFAYNGLTTIVTDANLHSKTILQNSQGRIVSATDAPTQTITYNYDPFGNLLNVQDPLGNITTVSIDLRARKLQMVDPDTGVTKYTYNAVGDLIRQVDAKNQTSLMSYDKLSRLTGRAEADLISYWYYDTGKNNAPCSMGVGNLCQAETTTGGTSVFGPVYNRVETYDPLGRPAQEIATIDAAYTTAVTYDANSRLATLTYPSGIVVKYVYSALGYLKEIRDNTSNALYWQANNFDAEGNLLLQTYGNTVQTTETYYPANGRVKAIQAGAGNAVQNFTYQYDNVGSLSTRTDANQTLTENFLYDPLNRLSTATVNSSGAGIATTNYGYDVLGNIKNRSDLGAYTYPASGATSVGPHAVSRVDLSAGGYRSYAYDLNGNMTGVTQYDTTGVAIASKSQTVGYSSYDLPVSLASSAVNVRFDYGPEHQRIREISSVDGTTIYVNPDNSGGLIYEKDTRLDNSVEQRNFITAGGQVVAMVKQLTAAGATTVQVRYFQRDNLGSTTTVTNEAGAVLEQFAYEPFGKRRFPSGVLDPNNTIVPATGERGFTNHEHVDELGLIHMNGRMYDPQIGRFMGADPIVQAPYDLQSFNRYSYVFNGPLTFVDPSGLDCTGSDPTAWSMGSNGDTMVVTTTAYCNTPPPAAVTDPCADGLCSGSTSDFNWPSYPPSYPTSYPTSSSPSHSPGPSNSAAAAPLPAFQQAQMNQQMSRFDYFNPTFGQNVSPNSSNDSGWTKLDNAVGHFMGWYFEKALPNLFFLAVGGPVEGGAAVIGVEGAGAVVARTASWGLSISTTKAALASAQQAYKGSTIVGHALSKHAGRNPNVWGTTSGSMKTWNEQGMVHLRDVIRGPGEFAKQAYEDGLMFLEKRLPDGRGVRLNMDGTFKGFLD
jgi:RHS repeat-associated protein